MRVGDALGPARDAMTEKADCPSEKWWQLIFVVDPQRTQLLFEQAGGIGRAPIESQSPARIESDERVAAEVFAAFDALEEERVCRVAGQCCESGNRRERIGAQLPNDGDDVVVV